MVDIHAMSEKPFEFHNFALRVPKELFRIVEGVSWENRTSVNIQMIDLLLIGLVALKNETLQDFFGPGSFSLDIDAATGKAVNSVPNNRIANVDELREKAKAALDDLMRDNPGEFLLPLADLLDQYPAWRNRK
jgi:hypothetical protein